MTKTVKAVASASQSGEVGVLTQRPERRLGAVGG